MRVSQVRISNYRSHQDTTIDLDDYTALVGSNGAGKSSVFYALRWFFEGGELDARDVSQLLGAGDSQEGDPIVSVSVSFVEITPADKERLGEYARGDTAHFTRSWSVREKKTKVFGNALAGPGFPEVRRETRVTYKRGLYKTSRTTAETLPDLGSSPSADAIDQALADWESLETNESSLVQVTDSDANHLFGINGKNVIRECIRMILVPAGTDITTDVGAAGRGTTLSDLIGAVIARASASAREAWQEKYQREIAELNKGIRTGVQAATAAQANRINARLANFVPSASVEFESTVPDWTPKSDPSVSTLVSIGGSKSDLANQGHGTQRAVMIAMFQSLAPDRESMIAEYPQSTDEDDEAYDFRVTKAVSALPTLLICVEEPEIYQHPVRARAFARVLSALAEQPNAQVAVATHSPYFVRPSQFENLRRLQLNAGLSEVHFATIAQSAKNSDVAEEKFRLTIERHLPTIFSEGFFSDGVVLVEGDTDKVCLEGIADALNFSLDLAGVSVIPVGGKPELRMAYSILRALNVDVYVVADGDFESAGRRSAESTEKFKSSHKSNSDQTAALSTWLPTSTVNVVAGNALHTFGDATSITSSYTVWHDDIESELALWPSFMSALSVAGERFGARRLSHIVQRRCQLKRRTCRRISRL